MFSAPMGRKCCINNERPTEQKLLDGMTVENKGKTIN